MKSKDPIFWIIVGEFCCFLFHSKPEWKKDGRCSGGGTFFRGYDCYHHHPGYAAILDDTICRAVFGEDYLKKLQRGDIYAVHEIGVDLVSRAE